MAIVKHLGNYEVLEYCFACLLEVDAWNSLDVPDTNLNLVWAHAHLAVKQPVKLHIAQTSILKNTLWKTHVQTTFSGVSMHWLWHFCNNLLLMRLVVPLSLQVPSFLSLSSFLQPIGNVSAVMQFELKWIQTAEWLDFIPSIPAWFNSLCLTLTT